MKRILALVLRAVLILRVAFARGSDFYCSVRADGANLACLNFTDERDFSEAKHRLDLRGLKFNGKKFHKAAERGKI